MKISTRYLTPPHTQYFDVAQQPLGVNAAAAWLLLPVVGTDHIFTSDLWEVLRASVDKKGKETYLHRLVVVGCCCFG